MSNSKGFLIMESANTVTPQVLSETKNSVRFKAEIQEAERPNRNGRIYGKDLIDSAINAVSVKEKMKHKAFYGRICPSI